MLCVRTKEKEKEMLASKNTKMHVLTFSYFVKIDVCHHLLLDNVFIIVVGFL